MKKYKRKNSVAGEAVVNVTDSNPQESFGIPRVSCGQPPAVAAPRKGCGEANTTQEGEAGKPCNQTEGVM